MHLDDLQRTSEVEKFENDVDQVNAYEDEDRPYDLDRQSPTREPQVDMSIMPDLSAQYEVKIFIFTSVFVIFFQPEEHDLENRVGEFKRNKFTKSFPLRFGRDRKRKQQRRRSSLPENKFNGMNCSCE